MICSLQFGRCSSCGSLVPLLSYQKCHGCCERKPIYCRSGVDHCIHCLASTHHHLPPCRPLSYRSHCIRVTLLPIDCMHHPFVPSHYCCCSLISVTIIYYYSCFFVAMMGAILAYFSSKIYLLLIGADLDTQFKAILPSDNTVLPLEINRDPPSATNPQSTPAKSDR